MDMLILSLDPLSIDYFATLNICVDHKLYRSLIYVSELNGDFVSPANKILEACVQIKDAGGNHEKIEEYLWLLYLEIIKLSEGKTISDTQLSPNFQHQGLASLFVWMTVEENVRELVNFNATLYFEVLSKLVTYLSVIEIMEQEP